MKTLNEQIERVRGLLRKCYGVIASKNGIVPEVGERNMENLPNAIASTHDTLEELTITQNGEYTPQEGVDGFSKVVARVVPTKRVVLSNMQVKDTQIIDGYWAGELVDTSQLTNMQRMFYECSQLQNLDVSGWNVSSVTNMQSMFYHCSQLQSLDVSNWDVSSVTNMYGLFAYCSQLQNLDVSNWDVSSVTNMYGLFQNCENIESIDCKDWDISNVSTLYAMFWHCKKLKHIDVSNWDTRNVNDITVVFRGCESLQKIDLTRWDVSNVTSAGSSGMFQSSGLISIIGDYTIDDVLQNNISCLNGLKVSFNTGKPYYIDRASLRALINGLADLTGQTVQTLTIGATLMAKLTEEDIAIATNKNWTIV